MVECGKQEEAFGFYLGAPGFDLLVDFKSEGFVWREAHDRELARMMAFWPPEVLLRVREMGMSRSAGERFRLLCEVGECLTP